MSSLHPFDEVDVRKGSNLATLTAKQMLAAQIAAQTAEWLAAGNCIQHPPIAAYKHVPFEITPKGKPKAEPEYQARAVKAAKAMVEEQSEALRMKIINFMHKHGRPVIPITVAHALDISRQKAGYHLDALHNQGRIDLVGKLARAPMYEVTP